MSSFHNAVFSSFTEGSFTRGEEQKRGVGVVGASSPTSGRVVYRLTSPRRRNDVRGSVQVAESHLNTKNKNTCGEESRDLEVDDSARGPFKAGRECGGGGGGGEGRGRGGGFCLETTLSNLLQDADISRKLSSCRGGVSWGRGCHSPPV